MRVCGGCRFGVDGEVPFFELCVCVSRSPLPRTTTHTKRESEKGRMREAGRWRGRWGPVGRWVAGWGGRRGVRRGPRHGKAKNGEERQGKYKRAHTHTHAHTDALAGSGTHQRRWCGGAAGGAGKRREGTENGETRVEEVRRRAERRWSGLRGGVGGGVGGGTLAGGDGVRVEGTRALAQGSSTRAHGLTHTKGEGGGRRQTRKWRSKSREAETHTHTHTQDVHT